MSKIGQYRVGLQEMSEYSDGAAAFERKEPRHCFVLTGDAQTAWYLGYDDARDERNRTHEQ